MNLKSNLLALSLVFTSSISLAGEYTKDIVIDRLHPISISRPANTSMQDLTRVYFTQSAGWADIGCRNDAADLLATDEHLMSILLVAWTTSKSIKVYVDNGLKPDGEVCQITALMVN
ncbi:hypothetical protein [Reinekea sp. G2M2-21]|uniref:hypothetical protein n=1 Tax=Reinekea sp. G2M2-21 TaxID=2788942 RepID=UPI0018A8AED1|nr:hypothetical protein [Reinekea sp. G2M2-21]